MATSYEMRKMYNDNMCLDNDDLEDRNLDERIDRAILLALEVTELLKQIAEIDPCSCIGFTKEQLTVAKRRSQRLEIILKRVILRISFTDITFPYYSLLLVTAARVAQAIEGITLLLNEDFCSEDEYDYCKTLTIYETTLLDMQTALNNLIAIAKFLMIE